MHRLVSFSCPPPPPPSPPVLTGHVSGDCTIFKASTSRRCVALRRKMPRGAHISLPRSARRRLSLLLHHRCSPPQKLVLLV